MDQLISYYQVQSSAWLGYAGIVWNRFNWMLTLQLAMIGFFFTNYSKTSFSVIYQFHISTVGLIVAILWLFMGIEDFRSMDKHRKRVKNLERKIEKELVDTNIKTNPSKVGRSIFRQSYLLIVFPTVAVISWLVTVLVN